ncbi:MAG: aminotransferase class V-fold PLP-dependent enzyme [Candidatus Eisenbacteria bacterium]
MIREVYLDHATFADIPSRFEAGTPNIAGAIGMARPSTTWSRLAPRALQQHEASVMAYALRRLRSMGGFPHPGPAARASEQVGALSFADREIHPHDLDHPRPGGGGDSRRTPLRAALHRRYGIVASARASFYLYNDQDDVDALINALANARAYFG